MFFESSNHSPAPLIVTSEAFANEAARSTMLCLPCRLLCLAWRVRMISAQEHDALHKGRFGFPVSNFLALTPLNNAWCDTWTEFFKRRMADQIEGLLKVNKALRGRRTLACCVLQEVLRSSVQGSAFVFFIFSIFMFDWRFPLPSCLQSEVGSQMAQAGYGVVAPLPLR